MSIGFTFGRFMTGAIISAGLAVGGVWTVVTLSLTGMTSAIDATNQAITRLDNRLIAIEQRFDSRLAGLEVRMDNLVIQVGNGFKDTKTELQKKASLNENVTPFASLDDLNFGGDIAAAIKQAAEREVASTGAASTLFLPTDGAFKTLAEIPFNWKPDPDQPLVYANGWSVTGSFSYDDLMEQAQRLSNGVTLKGQTGVDYSVVYSGGKLLLRDGTGSQAEILGEKDAGANLKVFNIDSVLPSMKLPIQ